MILLLLGLLCSIWGEPALCLEEDGGFSFSGNLSLLAVSSSSVYISTEEKLYQLSHDLTLIHNLTQRGILENEEEFYRVSMNAVWNATLSVNVLLPFVKNNTLISCGVIDHNLCGYCQILDLKNISKVVYKETIQVGPRWSSSGSVSFLVDVKKDSVQTETYILTAIQNHGDKTKEDRCAADLETINLHNTVKNQNGGIFSALDQSGSSKPGIQTESDVEFVDGFQINSTVYLFSNVASGAKTNKVRLLWLQAKTSKTETLRSLHGATLSTSDGGEGSRLLASSVIPGGQQVLWSGVFSEDGGESNTQLLLFDISPKPNRGTYRDPDFYMEDKPNSPSYPKPLTPEVVLFKKKYMRSVLAMKQDSWTVFFIGTTNGQLIKLAVDKNNLRGWPKEYKKFQTAFSKIHLDNVDHRHVFLEFNNKIQRVPVSNCSEYTSVKDCFTAKDPFCVWCVSNKRCTFKDDCKDKDGWLSIHDESQQDLVSHRAERDSTGQVKLVVQVHLTAAHNVRSKFACQISDQLCRPDGTQPQYPQCTCTLTEILDSNERDVTVTITFGETELTENIKLIDCSTSSLSCQQCIRAGCGWRQNSCSWANEEEQHDNVCQNINSQQNLESPKITSITPSLVSFYGRNHALLEGRNLRNVIGVKVQAELDCSPQESPVWNNTGVSLTFHIPRRTNEAEANVCILLSDGSCHGEEKIYYQSAPSCTSISPTISWASGKRKITIVGSYLESVEEAVDHINSTIITYETPAWKSTDHHELFLKVANETLLCQQNIYYYPDPQFPKFIAKSRENGVLVMIQSIEWGLGMTTEDLAVWGVEDDKQYPCIMKGKTEPCPNPNCFICEIQNTTGVKFSQLMIKYGQMTVQVWNPPLYEQYLLNLRLLLVPFVTAVLAIICQCLI